LLLVIIHRPPDKRLLDYVKLYRSKKKPPDWVVQSDGRLPVYVAFFLRQRLTSDYWSGLLRLLRTKKCCSWRRL